MASRKHNLKTGSFSAPLLTSKTVPTPGELVELESVKVRLALSLSHNSGEFRKSRRELLELPHRLVAFAAAEAIESAPNSRTFDRLARLLAEIGGDIAASALVGQAFGQRRFPRLASRALAICNHPSVIPALIELVSKGSVKQSRAAARYLLKHQKGRGVEPLCRV